MTAFNEETCIAAGLTPERDYYRIEGTGWRIYDATGHRDGDTYVWGYSHVEDCKEYGEVETLADALRNIVWSNNNGMGDATAVARHAAYDAWAKAVAL